MIYQGRNITDYKKGSEVLYALAAVDEIYGKPIGRIAIQKVIYLAQVLSPILKTILAYLKNYRKWIRGPYDYTIQNLIDHLAMTGYVKISDYEKKGKTELSNYSISEEGIKTVNKLIQLESEEYKLWVYQIVVKMTMHFIDRNHNYKWDGFDRIIDLVYKDLTYNEAKKEESPMIDLDSPHPTSVVLNELYDFLVFKNNSGGFNSKLSDRKVAELAIYNYLEGVFSDQLKLD